jgi:hypothetical protein
MSQTTISRRQWLASTAAASFFTASEAWGALPAKKSAPSLKKGYAINTKRENWAKQLEQLNAKWFYTWNANRPDALPAGVEWFPMIHRNTDNNPAEKSLESVKEDMANQPKALLGFNEPDHADQANMTVEQALELWPKLEAAGLPLGSPAAVKADGEWMTAFMKQAMAKKFRIDFVTVHWYGSPDARQFMKHLDGVAKLYKKPIWITEFCPADWNAKNTGTNKHKERDVMRFITDIVPALERAEYIQRYAWFSAKPTDQALQCSVLCDLEGKITKLGEAYAAAG